MDDAFAALGDLDPRSSIPDMEHSKYTIHFQQI
jgi:hypothetical protein